MSRKVLVIDESPAFRSILQIYLRDDGCTILEAESAERALQVLRLVKLDLIIASVKTPRMGGLGLLRALRRDEASREAPLLLLAPQLTPALLQEAEAAGASAMLEKPVSGQRLTEAIERILGRAPRAADGSGAGLRGTGRLAVASTSASGSGGLAAPAVSASRHAPPIG
jgi:two-component system chemotaxis response regulator CheY